MPRSARLYLVDIQTALSRIEGLMAELDEETFKAGSLTVDGILFNLMTIGEAAKHIPPDIRTASPEINWREIGRFRDFVVHHYYKLDMNKAWDIVHVDLPPLKTTVERLLQEIKDQENGEE